MPKTQSRSRARNRSNTAESPPATRRNFVVRRQLELNLGATDAGEPLVEPRPRVIRLRDLQETGDAGSTVDAASRGGPGSATAADSSTGDSSSAAVPTARCEAAPTARCEAAPTARCEAAPTARCEESARHQEPGQVVLEPVRRRVAVIERPTAPRRRIVLSRLDPDGDRTADRQALTTRRLATRDLGTRDLGTRGGDGLEVRPLGSATASVEGNRPVGRELAAADLRSERNGQAQKVMSIQTEPVACQMAAGPIIDDADVNESSGGRPPLLELIGFCATLFVFMAAAAWL